jgi:aryl-alcohol dehydrogenase-like predicted oxidoreductase
MNEAPNFDDLHQQKTVFGRTGFDITPMSFGGAAVSGEGGGYGFGEISENDSIDLIHYAYDRGINLFDSAPIYGFGLSEKRIGKAVQSFRDKVWLTSKSGVHWDLNKRVDMNNDPKIAEKMLLQSLKDLSTDYIDLYFVHWPDEKFDIRRPLEVLQKYKEKGAIRHLGLCNTNLNDLTLSKDVCQIEVVQSEYHLFNRAVEVEILPFCQQHEMGFMSWGTLDKGILTGKYQLDKNRDASDCRRSAPWWNKKHVAEKVELVEQMKVYLRESDWSMMDLAIAFNLKNKALSTLLIGAKNKEQLDGNIRAIAKANKLANDFDHWDKVEELAATFSPGS